jgi:hypothetical protein
MGLLGDSLSSRGGQAQKLPSKAWLQQASAECLYGCAAVLC